MSNSVAIEIMIIGVSMLIGILFGEYMESRKKSRLVIYYCKRILTAMSMHDDKHLLNAIDDIGHIAFTVGGMKALDQLHDHVQKETRKAEIWIKNHKSMTNEVKDEKEN